MVDQLPNPSKFTLYSGLLFLVVFTTLSLGYFVVESVHMLQELYDLTDYFYFNKGVFYLPGVVLGLSMLMYAIVHESVLRKTLTRKKASICTRIGIGSVIVMVVLPQLVDYGVDEYFTKLGYGICSEASHQWLHSKTIVYARNSAVCESLAKQN